MIGFCSTLSIIVDWLQYGRKSCRVQVAKIDVGAMSKPSDNAPNTAGRVASGQDVISRSKCQLASRSFPSDCSTLSQDFSIPIDQTISPPIFYRWQLSIRIFKKNLEPSAMSRSFAFLISAMSFRDDFHYPRWHTHYLTTVTCSENRQGREKCKKVKSIFSGNFG